MRMTTSLPMRPLLIDDDARAKAARVVAHAEKHHYYPKSGQLIPGDDPNFVAEICTYRVVFSITHSDNAVWRHMSVSVPGKHYANPICVLMLADLFGFTGWDHRSGHLPDGWYGSTNGRDRCVTIVQKLSSEMH